MESGELRRRFGRHVQGLREAAGLTQEQLAGRIGRSVDTVGNIERGVNATRIEVAHRIATELGVGLSDLFAFEPKPGAPAAPALPEGAGAMLELLRGCDADTIRGLTELVRVGLGLTRRA